MRGGPRARGTARGLPIDAVRIGHLEGELFDPRCAWLRHRQVGPEGAVLVRPDRFIAWRSLRLLAGPGRRAGERLSGRSSAAARRPEPAGG